jgi:hypothetical protein
MRNTSDYILFYHLNNQRVYINADGKNITEEVNKFDKEDYDARMLEDKKKEDVKNLEITAKDKLKKGDEMNIDQIYAQGIASQKLLPKVCPDCYWKENEYGTLSYYSKDKKEIAQTGLKRNKDFLGAGLISLTYSKDNYLGVLDTKTNTIIINPADKYERIRVFNNGKNAKEAKSVEEMPIFRAEYKDGKDYFCRIFNYYGEDLFKGETLPVKQVISLLDYREGNTDYENLKVALPVDNQNGVVLYNAYQVNGKGKMPLKAELKYDNVTIKNESNLYFNGKLVAGLENIAEHLYVENESVLVFRALGNYRWDSCYFSINTKTGFKEILTKLNSVKKYDRYNQMRKVAIYKNNNLFKDNAGLCMSKSGKVVTTFFNEKTDEIVVREYSDLITNKFTDFTKKRKKSPPHKILTLSNGNYAVSGRDFFMILDKDRKNVLYFLNDSAYIQSLRTSQGITPDWQRSGVSAGLSSGAEFLKMAESPDGKYLALLAIKYNNNNYPSAYIYVFDLKNNMKVYKKNFYNDLKTNPLSDQFLDLRNNNDLLFLDNKTLLFSCLESDKSKEGVSFLLYDIDALVENKKLSEVEISSLNPHAYSKCVNSIFVDTDGTIYYSISLENENMLVKAKFENKKINILKTTRYRPMQIIVNYDNEHLLVADSKDLFKVKKSELTDEFVISTYTLSSDIDVENARILELKPLDVSKKKWIALYHQTTGKLGNFHLMRMNF